MPMASTTFRRLPVATRAYIAVIIVAGATTVFFSASDLIEGRIHSYWFYIALLTLACGSATVHLASIPVAISVSETFVFTSALLFGASAGTLTVALDAAVISFWSYRRGQPLFKIVFNVCALPLTIWLAAHVFFLLADVQPLFRTTQDVQIPSLVGPLLVFTIVYFLLSSWIITFAISLEKAVPPFKIWRDNFLWISLNYFGGASIALLLVRYTKDFDLSFLVIVVPLLAVLYATYAVTIGRFEDANRHLTELNSLYMATIETLAMAIDAKDQVTHGHIRRVQNYAVGLAHELGVRDKEHIRAIEAAALLHDMGKLAVPEYILNKPGPLTAAEFEKMKLHASVGADILASINFPYPVVPIVRHHHESWDGSGYPDGLRGTDIPIGARILSVVDCFDALTSDRPYRPRLADQEAIRILLDRRGTMYDPLIVDKFISTYNQLTPAEPQGQSQSKQALTAITRVALPLSDSLPERSGLNDIAASTEEMLVLYDLARSLAGRFRLSDAAEIITQHLRRIVPASTCVFFVYQSDRDELLAAHTSGEHASKFAGLRIPIGSRLSGWVAANRKTILNSDPILDLGEGSRAAKDRLKSCLSTPLTNRDQLVGVLSVYSSQSAAFTDDHRRIIEVIARQISRVVASAIDTGASDQPPLSDDATGLPLAARLESFVTSELEATEHLTIVLVYIHLVSPDFPDGKLPTPVLAAVVSACKRALRGGDVLARYSDRELMALLAQTDAAAADSVRGRMLERLSELPAHNLGQLAFFVACATAPADGHSLEGLVETARKRSRAAATSRKGYPSIH